MKEYKGRKLLKRLSGRLIPGNSGLPDCICEILLTEDTVYVLEDEFNGEYTTHYAIPCSHIARMEKYTEGSGGRDQPTVVSYAIMALIGLIGGMFVLPGKGSVQNTRTDYLRIICADGADKEHHLYFSDVEGSLKGFIKAFNQTKTHSIAEV